MLKAFSTRGLALAALAAATVLAGCKTTEPAPAPVAPPPPPPIALNEGVAQAASIYVGFLREARTIQPGGFTDAESIQAAIRKGAAYDPIQLSRGLIAYGAVISLQSPEFVAGVRQYASDPAQRQELIARINADPSAATTLPGADAAAGLIAGALVQDAMVIHAIAEAIEADAYTIQERRDPRRRWAVTPIRDREVRLAGAKTLSAQSMLPSAEESSRLFSAANLGSGLTEIVSSRRGPPYTAAVTRSLAIGALAALGAAGDDYRANTDALQVETNNEFCLNMSKLMLFQCLAASRPSYEDMFCLGRHITRDLATCTNQAVSTTTITVGDPVEVNQQQSTVADATSGPSVTPAT